MTTANKPSNELVAENKELHIRLEKAEETSCCAQDLSGSSGISLVVTDLTQQKRNEEILASEKLARSIIEQAGEAIFVCDEAGIIIRASRLAQQLCGENPLLKPFNELLQLRIAETECLFTVLTPLRGGIFESVEVEYMRREDQLFHLILNATPLMSTQNRIIGCVVTLTDITERRQAELAQRLIEVRLHAQNLELSRLWEKSRLAEESLKKLNEELEGRVVQRTEELREKDQMLLLQSRQAAMGEMVSNIAHQWRQPLNTLGLMTQQLLLFYDLGGFDREFLENVVSKSMDVIHHMSKTIDDFRNYFRPNKEKVEFNVQEAIKNALSLLEGSFQNPQISVEIVTKDDAEIFGYQNEFAQVILNILINARDALIEREIVDPRVMITLTSNDGHSVITIADNAGGIPEEIMEKVFDPYFTTKGPQRGTGVGLYMSKTIIESNMGGKLTAHNLSDGAEFRIEV